jgi:hypothetical protein
MRTFPALVIATAIGFADLAHAGSVPVPDLTGTWTGKLSCKGISTEPLLFGGFKFVDKAATIEITQADEALTAALSAVDTDFAFPLQVDPMCGSVVVNAANPKQVRAGLVAGLISGPGFAFAVDFSTVKVFPANGKGVTGKLMGSGVLISSSLGGGTSGSCKYAFERTSDAPPPPPASCDVMM